MGKVLKRLCPTWPLEMIVAVIAADMAGEQPLHPAAQIAILVRPQHDVKMVVEKAIAEQPQRQALVRGDHQLDKGRKVTVCTKNIGSPVATIQNVVADPPTEARAARGIGYIVAIRPPTNKKNQNVPFLPLHVMPAPLMLIDMTNPLI
jgi:hypothetical protein